MANGVVLMTPSCSRSYKSYLQVPHEAHIMRIRFPRDLQITLKQFLAFRLRVFKICKEHQIPHRMVYAISAPRFRRDHEKQHRHRMLNSSNLTEKTPRGGL